MYQIVYIKILGLLLLIYLTIKARVNKKMNYAELRSIKKSNHNFVQYHQL